jgi:hypothetical protein
MAPSPPKPSPPRHNCPNYVAGRSGNLAPVLPPRQRAVVVLRYFEHLSEAETAQALGCSVGTVESAMARRLARLREMTASRQEAEAPGKGVIMGSDMEELAGEGIRQFTATMQVSPDLAAKTCQRHRPTQARWPGQRRRRGGRERGSCADTG